MAETQPARGILPPSIKADRSTPSRSEQPSMRCSTITTATSIGGTLRRPHVSEQVREHRIRKQPLKRSMQHPIINRLRADPAIAEPGRRPKQRLPRRQPQTDNAPSTRNPSGILTFSPQRPSNPPTATRRIRPSPKNTSHLACLRSYAFADSEQRRFPAPHIDHNSRLGAFSMVRVSP